MAKKKTNRRKKKSEKADNIIVRRRVIPNKICERCENRKEVIYFDTYDVMLSKPRMKAVFCKECVTDLLKQDDVKETSMFDILHYMLDPEYQINIVEQYIEEKEESEVIEEKVKEKEEEENIEIDDNSTKD